MDINSQGAVRSCSQVKKKTKKLTFTALTSGPEYQQASTNIDVVTLLYQSTDTGLIIQHWDNITKH